MTQKAPMSKPLTADEIRSQHEINGARRANTNLIAYALEQLKPGDDRTNVEKLAAMTLEREQAVAGLRRLAEHYGESEWPEGLSLPEIIDKHIALPISVLLAKAPEKSKR
jgi:hypothetical protein